MVFSCRPCKRHRRSFAGCARIVGVHPNSAIERPLLSGFRDAHTRWFYRQQCHQLTGRVRRGSERGCNDILTRRNGRGWPCRLSAPSLFSVERKPAPKNTRSPAPAGFFVGGSVAATSTGDPQEREQRQRSAMQLGRHKTTAGQPHQATRRSDGLGPTTTRLADPCRFGTTR